MNFRFRKINQTDYPFLREMLYEAIFIPEGSDLLDKSIIDIPQLSKYIENWQQDSGFGIIVIIGNKPIGAVWARLFKMENKGYGFVHEKIPELSMAISRNYRNKGIGTELLKRFITFGKELGYSSVSLSVDKRNEATKFYKKLGFTILEECGTAYTMIKRLT
jgi:[ribosomal protein S18]-alanine N-acetyltransferase